MNAFTHSPPGRRSFLFLQGMASQFFRRLGQELASQGHAVHRVNFNGGDAVFWRLPGAINFRGRREAWPDFFADVLLSRQVTDVILFGDCRPLHQDAIAVARRMQVPIHVCEEGYLRPHWVTFERDGVNGHSSLPRNPDYYREEALRVPPLGQIPHVVAEFRRRALEDVLYNVSSMLMMGLYPHYKTHRPHHRLVEYGGWLAKMARGPRARRRSQKAVAQISADADFYLFPLQLNCDTQIREHSTFGSMRPVIETVLRSFQAHAPDHSILVVKEHPLDDGLINWRRIVTQLAAQIGIADRVVYLEVGDMNDLIARTRGVVTVNSTSGTLALAIGAPVIVLGIAIYDIVGLTHQGGLDSFWTNATPPDPALFAAFRQVLASRCLLVGGFFSSEGIRQLVANAAARLSGQVAAHPVHASGGVRVRDNDGSAVPALPS